MRPAACDPARMHTVHDSRFTASGGLQLHQRDWIAAQPRARLLLVHGLGEHSGRYARLADDLVGAGISVRAYDHRGHGRSEGERARVDGHNTQLAHDLLDVFAAYASEGEDVPFVFGHSMGGLVAMYAVVVMGLMPRGLIASSPALRTHASRFQRRLAGRLVHWLPHLRLRSGLPAEHLSHDPRIIEDFRSDPLNHDRISARLAHFIFLGGQRVIEQAATLKVPTLLQFAADDRFVDPAGAREFAAAAPPRKLEVHEYQRLYHEIYNETDAERSQVVSDLFRWLDLHLDPPKRPCHP